MTSNLFARHCPQGMPHAPIAPCALALKAKIPGRTPTPSHGNPLSLHATRPALHTINTADHDAKPGRTKNGRGIPGFGLHEQDSGNKIPAFISEDEQ